MTLRVALFVEGSGESTPTRQEQGALARIWRELLPAALGLRCPHRLIPISKRNLIALDPSLPPPPGSIPLDILIAAELRREPFDAAIIAWDLQPPWRRDSSPCRWQETLDLYRHLSESEELPPGWKERALARYDDLRTRARPDARVALPRIRAHEILPLCMEPMFESILQDERIVLKALGLSRRPRDWPTGWKRRDLRSPDRDLLQRAIVSAQRIPSPRRGKIVDQIPGDMMTRKNEWGAFLLDRIALDSDGKSRMTRHPLAKRLTELLAGPLNA